MPISKADSTVDWDPPCDCVRSGRLREGQAEEPAASPASRRPEARAGGPGKELRAAPLSESLLRMMQVACMQGLMT